MVFCILVRFKYLPKVLTELSDYFTLDWASADVRPDRSESRHRPEAEAAFARFWELVSTFMSFCVLKTVNGLIQYI